MRRTLDEHLLEKKPEDKIGQKWYNLLFVFLLIGFIISASISWYEVETVVGSGLIMSILGIIFSVIAHKVNKRFSVFLGLTPLAITTFWYVTISFFDLSPGDCEFIIPLFLSISTVFVFILGLNTYRNRNVLR